MKRILYGACLGIVLSVAVNARAATLVENGHARAVIVIPAGQKSPAAGELQHYLLEAAGAKVPIVAEDKLDRAQEAASRVFVGSCQAARRVVDLQKLEPEGFVIKTVGDDLFIVGRDTTDAGLPVDGTFYGVCEFLERYLGVRWLMAGPLGEVVPKQVTIRVADTDLRQEPLLWQRKIRNVKAGGHKDLIRRILQEWNVPLSQWETTFSKNQTAPWFEHQRLGGRVKLSYGHSYGGWWNKYHEQHPDIFALQPNGTRVNTAERERLCVSNPTLWDLVAQDRLQQLRANRQLTAASISPNDGGANQFCCCARCRSWDAPSVQEIYRRNPEVGQEREIPLTDRYFRFYNEVAKRVKQIMPDRFLGCYAYSRYRTPPQVLDHLEDNLIVGYVGFNSYWDDAQRKLSRDEWLQWSKLAKQLFLRPNLLSGAIGLPVNYVHKLAEDLRFLADHGMRATDFDGCVGNWGTQGLNCYVLAKLLWNPYQDVDPIVEDYCRAAYGTGADAMQAYYRRLEQLTDRLATHSKLDAAERGADIHQLTDAYTDAELAELEACVTRAIAAIGARDPAALERARLVATGLEYTRKTRDLLAAAAAVRQRRSNRAQFQKLHAETLAYYQSLALSWAVAVEHNYRHIRRGLGLKPASPEKAEQDTDLDQVSPRSRS